MNKLSMKLLQRLNQQNNHHGFTLIELLVVIIIIGVLSAIALPSFFKQADKGKEMEPTVKINGANKMQTSYYLENGEFSRELADLDLPNETENYEYDAEPIPLPREFSIVVGKPQDPQKLKYVVGVIYVDSNDGTAYQRVCKAHENQYFPLLAMLLAQQWGQADAQYCSGK